MTRRALHAGGAALDSAWSLVAIYGLSVLVYGLLARRQPIPTVFPDEFIYGNVAQNIAHGVGANWRGDGQGVPLLYPFLISLPYRIGSPVDGYLAAKVLGAAVASLVVVPIWLLARELTGPRMAAIPALLSVAGAPMTYTALLLSENLALPLGVASLAATVMALRRPGGRWIWLALGLAVVATYTRVLLASLVAVVLIALLLDVVRQAPGARSDRIAMHRIPLVVVGGAAGLGMIVALVSSTIGRYSLSTLGEIKVGRTVESVGQHGLSLAVMVGAVPVVATLALASRGANWRDDRSGPLLAVTLPAALVLLVVAGAFVEANGVPWPVERYIVYPGPLLFCALALAPGRVGWRAVAAIGAGLALTLLALPKAEQPPEQAAVWGATKRLASLGDSFGRHPDVWIALVALAAVLGAAALLWRIASAPIATLTIAAIPLVLMLLAAQASWHDQFRRADDARTFLPSHLDFADRAASAPVGLVNEGEAYAYDLAAGRRLRIPEFQIELFNRHVSSVYDAQLGQAGQEHVKLCPWRIAVTGVPITAPRCSPAPSTLLFLSGSHVSTLRGERVISRPRGDWRLVRTPGRPRVLAVVRTPCNPAACSGGLQVNTWLDRPGAVIGEFIGGSAPTQIAAGNRTYPLAPGARQDVNLPVGRGAGQVRIVISGSGAFPEVHVLVREGRTTTQVY